MTKKHLAIFFAAAFAAFSCSDKSEGTGITIDPGKDIEANIPDYEDDYSAIASWDNHSKWNLANVHDPSIAYYEGSYYMYCTDASYGNEHEKATTGRHFQGKRSRDLVNWNYVPGPMNDAPAWVADSLASYREKMGLTPVDASKYQYGYWAPVVRTVNVGGQDRLRMYYCIVVLNSIKTGSMDYDGSWSERSFIGMCESTDPASGKWEDKGFVTCSSSDKGPDGWKRNGTGDWDAYFYYNAIDPTYLVDDNSGRHYLIYGSWHSGFALLEIDPESGMPVGKPLGDPWSDSADELKTRYGSFVGTRTAGSRWQGSEAPEIIYRDGYYYLFMAYDGLDVPYNTRVVRSKNIEGPYTDITGRNFTNGRGDFYPIVTHPYRFSKGYGWVGISHCCVFRKNGTDEWFYCSQGRLPANVGGNAYSNAIMMGHVRRIVWCPSSPDSPDDLWPIALPERYAGIDGSKPITKDELVGKWEHINLAYNYAKQDVAENLELKADGTMSGALNGSWSYDQATSRLTLGNVVVVLAREADWEATPRVATIVYAGTSATLNATYWGKKVN
ncbi:MAG: arabinan endo-1,5-alpha-L-arabinosidase [Candidatus Cryptobacteroides sp.]